MSICLSTTFLIRTLTANALSIDTLRDDIFTFNASQLINGNNIQSLQLDDINRVINSPLVDVDIQADSSTFKTDIRQSSRRNVFRVKFNRNEAACNAGIDVQVQVEDTFGRTNQLSDPSNKANYIGITYQAYEHRRRCYSRNRGIRRIIYRFNLNITDLSSAGNAAHYSGNARILISAP